VEHCTNCEGHATTTKHVPGQYDKAFAALSAAVHEAIGDVFPVEILSNPNFRPRVGAFEVDLIFAAKVREICAGNCEFSLCRAYLRNSLQLYFLAMCHALTL
jgi:hypothetical protein